MSRASTQNRLFRLTAGRRWQEVVTRVSTCSHEAECISEDRWTALHVACCCNAPEEVIRALLNVYPRAASMEDYYGFTPLHCLCYLFRIPTTFHPEQQPELHGRLMSIMKNRQSNMHCNNSKNPFDTDEFRTTIWPKACLIIKAAYHGTIADPLPEAKAWQVVHACATLKTCPPNLMQLAARLHPEQLREKNEDDKVPLHLVISSGRQWDCGFEAIVTGCPYPITKRDEKSRLFPFMLASVGNGGSLDAAYHMLRACPELERYITN